MAFMVISKFLQRCAEVQANQSLSRSRLSTILFGSGITLDRLLSGRSVTVRVLERAERRLDQVEARDGAS